MEELIKWLRANKIVFGVVDKEVVEIEDFGKMFVADLSGVQSIFRFNRDQLEFNLMENPDTLMDEGIYHVAFPFGKNWYFYDLREAFRFYILKYVGKREPAVLDIPYVNLGVHTPFELLNGSGEIGLWVKKAKLMGHTALGICDRNTMAATLQLQKECAKAGIGHVFGYSCALEYEGEKVDIKIYCQKQKGLQHLLRIQKAIHVDSDSQTIGFDELVRYGNGNVLVLGKLSSYWITEHLEAVKRLREAFIRVFYQVDLNEYKAERYDLEVLEATRYFFHSIFENSVYGIDPILICDNYYLDKDEAKNKITLNKIATGASHRQSDEQYFKNTDELYASFVPLFDAERWDVEPLFRDMCQRTLEIAGNATARYELGKMYMPQYVMKEDEKALYRDNRRMFIALLEQALYKKVPASCLEKYRRRLEEEIYIIESTNNVDYFLIQWDLVREAKSRGITTGVGRGSAGGSLVSYLLGITTIDPIEYELIFSRFLVPERCGLNRVDSTTIVGEDVSIQSGDRYVEVVIESKTYLFHKGAEFCVKRNGETVQVKAYELQIDDEVMFDHRDLLWTIKELTMGNGKLKVENGKLRIENESKRSQDFKG